MTDHEHVLHAHPLLPYPVPTVRSHAASPKIQVPGVSGHARAPVAPYISLTSVTSLSLPNPTRSSYTVTSDQKSLSSLRGKGTPTGTRTAPCWATATGCHSRYT